MTLRRGMRSDTTDKASQDKMLHIQKAKENATRTKCYQKITTRIKCPHTECQGKNTTHTKCHGAKFNRKKRRTDKVSSHKIGKIDENGFPVKNC